MLHREKERGTDIVLQMFMKFNIMDTQFNTLVRSYHDNYMQYKLTGNSSYENAYLSAKEGIENILSSMEGEVNEQTKKINEFYNTDMQNKLKNIRSQSVDAEKNFLLQSDQLEASKMRSEVSLPPAVTTADTSAQTQRLIIAGLVLGLILVL